MQVPSPTAGSVVLDQVELTSLDPEAMRRTRPVLQMIFQDPISALNPRRTVRDIVGEPLQVWWEEEDGTPPDVGVVRAVRSALPAGGQPSSPSRCGSSCPWPPSPSCCGSSARRSRSRAWEEELSWTQVPAQIIGFPVLAIAAAIVAVLFVLGVVWLALALIVPFGVVSKVLGNVPTAGRSGGRRLRRRRVGCSWCGGPGTASSVRRCCCCGCRDDRGGRHRRRLVPGLAAPAEPGRGLGDRRRARRSSSGSRSSTSPASTGSPSSWCWWPRPSIDFGLYQLVRRQLAVRQEEMRERAEPRVREMLETVGINPDDALDRKPFEFSGGQAQRLSIARALIMNPEGHHLRRAGVGPRRLGPGPDPQPAGGHEEAVRADPGLHRPRPGRGQERQRSGSGHVPGQDLRGGRPRRAVRAPRLTPIPSSCCRPSPTRIP